MGEVPLHCSQGRLHNSEPYYSSFTALFVIIQGPCKKENITYTYTYIYIHTHTHIYIYIYI